jgi:biopolymer transport protein ExbD
MLLGKRKKVSVDIPMASLPDIVFLLLIFFLVTTTIDAEKGLDLVLPPPDATEQEIAHKNLINLLVNAAGDVLLDGEVVEVRDITRVVKERLQDSPLLVVSVKTDKQTRYEVYIDVLDRLKKAWGDRPARISIAEPEEN